MSQEITINKSTLKKTGIFLALAAILVLGIFSVRAFSNSNEPTGNVIKQTGDFQVIKVKMSGNQYVFEPSTLKKDIPARLEIDLSTVNGCYRTIVIPGFNIKKSVKQGDNTIEFTPDKSGAFGVSCIMGMGRGQFNVAESSGVPSSYIDPSINQKPAGGSCGASGGCGCGGGV